MHSQGIIGEKSSLLNSDLCQLATRYNMQQPNCRQLWRDASQLNCTKLGPKMTKKMNDLRTDAAGGRYPMAERNRTQQAQLQRISHLIKHPLQDRRCSSKFVAFGATIKSSPSFEVPSPGTQTNMSQFFYSPHGPISAIIRGGDSQKHHHRHK